MPFCDRRNDLLIPFILRQALLDFGQCRFRALQIRFVHDHNIGHIEHDDFLQLQARAVIRIHDEHRLIDQLIPERQRFLSGSNCFDDDVIKSRMGKKIETTFRRRRQTAGLTARRDAAHEDAVVLRIDHGRAIA